MKPIRFTRRSRSHKIGKAHAYYVMANAPMEEVLDAATGDTQYVWTGQDDRGLTLNIIMVEKPDCFLVIHVAPPYRKGKS